MPLQRLGSAASTVESWWVRGFHLPTATRLRYETPATLLQLKLNALAELITKIGSLPGLLLLTLLMVCFFVQLGTEPNCTANQNAMIFVQILIISVTLIVAVVPEGARCTFAYYPLGI
jgi:P-type Ca2+ transporter type 2C